MDEPKNRRPGWVFWTTVALFILLVVYPLSLQPVNRLLGDGYIPWRFASVARIVYAPLIWLARHCEPLEDVLKWYQQCWLP